MACKNWIEIKNGKIVFQKGFKRGHYVICLDCKTIRPVLYKGKKHAVRRSSK